MKQFLLLEKHAVYRDAFALLLECSVELEALPAGSVEEARRALAAARDNVAFAIVNVDSLDENPIGLIEELRGADPAVPVLALTAGRSFEVRARALRAGAKDVFYLRDPLAKFADSVGRLLGAPQATTAGKIHLLLRSPA